jgi:hypothetical protein
VIELPVWEAGEVCRCGDRQVLGGGNESSGGGRSKGKYAVHGASTIIKVSPPCNDCRSRGTGYHTEISKVYPYIFGRGAYSADAGENYLIRPEFQRRITQSPLMPPRGSDQPRPGGRFSACLSSHLLLAAPLEATAH